MQRFVLLVIIMVFAYSITPGPDRYLELPVIFVVMCVFLFGSKGGKR